MQAGFMAGMLVGSSLFGAVSDSYGRRFCMFLCAFLTVSRSLIVKLKSSNYQFLPF